MATVTSLTFGELLKRYRTAAGLTQEALAERAGLSVRAISDFERATRRSPRPTTIHLLASALGLPAQERSLFEAVARQADGFSPVHARTRALPAADTISTHLVGRAPELALLRQHLAGESPPVLLFAGEPGIGKSRLLQEAAHAAQQDGWTVLASGCQRRGGQEPYAPLLGALAQYIQGRNPLALRVELQGCAWLIRLLPELADGPIDPLPAWALSPAQERRLMFAAVARFLANVAGPAGTMLVLDDLQWAEPDALDLVLLLLHSPTAAPLRIVGAYRSTEMPAENPVSAQIAAFAHAGFARQHMVSSLHHDDAEQLLDDLLAERGELPVALREQVLQRASGLPFFLQSWAQWVRHEQADAMAGEVPWNVAQSIRQRIAALPDGARELLRVAAVVGRHTPRALLVETLTWPQEDIVAALESACATGLLLEDGPAAYRFAHDVIRDVVEGDLSAARRALLHRRVVAVLEHAFTRPPELLAYHYARADMWDEAAEYLEQAGDQARTQYGHAAAESYYREAIVHLDAAGRAADAARVREKLGAVLRTVARYAEALPVLEQAAETYRARGEVDDLGRVTAQMAWVHSDRGTAPEVVTRVQSVLGPLEAQGSSRSLAALYAALSNLYYFMGRYPEQVVTAERAEQLARASGETSILAEALFGRGFGYYAVGRMAEALETLEMAIRVAEAAGHYYSHCYGLALVGDLYDERGDFAVSRRNTERALQIAERHGDQAMAALLMTGHGMSAFYMGDWPAARRDYERAVSLSRAVGISWSSAYPLLDLGRLCLAEGAWDEANRCLAECERLVASSTDRNARGEVASVLAERDLLAGEPEAARTRLAPLLGSTGLLDKGAAYLQPRLAWALLDLGDVEQAAAQVDQALALARAEQQRLYIVDALRVQAMVRLRQQRWDGVISALEEGLSLARSIHYPYAEGRLLHVYGQMHAVKGKPEPARERLEAALAIFRRLGARRDAERVEQMIAAL